MPVAVAEVVLTGSEFAAASLFVTLRALRWILAFWLAIGLLTLALSLRPGPAAPRSTTGLILVGMAFAIVLLSWVSARLQFRRLPAGRKRYMWRFFEDHIEMASAVGDARNQWELFVRVVETRSLFLFFPQRNICQIVPKRAFPDELQIDEVRRIAKKKLGRQAKIRRSSLA